MTVVLADELATADLVVDRVFQGGRRGNASDDPLNRLLPVSNMGGFRIIGGRREPRLVVLLSKMDNPDWPDGLDKETGLFTYFGDNREPGQELHATNRYGNQLLRDMFDRLHGGAAARRVLPPVLVFAKTGTYRDVTFLGLAAPGAANLDANADLVAVWKLRNGSRFQNYRAQFTILDVPVISREWIGEIAAGRTAGEHCPEAWRRFIDSGSYAPLTAPRAIDYRTRFEQLPQDALGKALLKDLYDHFKDDPYRFEACAARIAEIMLPAITGPLDLTRPVRDGGRDATGRFRIGEGDSSVLVDFALEAKCYGMDSSVGVRELSRLISRLRHRQFGILVTTSFVAAQAYQEIKDDGHPIVIICAADIARLLIRHGLGSKDELARWLAAF